MLKSDNRKDGPRKMTVRKPGQPTKYSKEVKRQLELVAKKGMTDAEMAEIVGVTEQTLNNWKKAHPGFFESLKEWKKEADHRVERSLYERATGYDHPETKTIYLPRHKEGDKWVEGHWETIDIIRHYPPDPTSMIFWLKNRNKESWRDRHDVDVSGDLRVEIQRFSENA